jgi:glyoxylase-like metal-dependent hydrolase (beta-lactamase superfamily II)
MKFGQFELSIVRECSFKLDGGAMFGVVPKALWDKVSPADQANRVPLVCNLLVIETPDGRVLVETGMGPRWTEKEIERFELKMLIDHEKALESVGLQNDEIDAVIMSHLHFDHAGGAVLKGADGELRPAFPKAKYYAQKGEWQLSKAANSRAKASYRADDLLPLEKAGVLQLIDGDTEILPGVWAKVTGGHTSHHQVIFADIMPTKSHIAPPWVMGYDHFPLDTCDVKSQWLAKAASENWLVIFDHEVDVPWGHIKDVGGKFEWQPLSSETLTSSRVNVLQR